MNLRSEIAAAEVGAARLLLAFDANDEDAYGLALSDVLADEGLACGVIATLVHTLAVTFDTGHPGWQDRTRAQLIGLLDELAENT